MFKQTGKCAKGRDCKNWAKDSGKSKQLLSEMLFSRRNNNSFHSNNLLRRLIF